MMLIVLRIWQPRRFLGSMVGICWGMFKPFMESYPVLPILSMGLKHREIFWNHQLLLLSYFLVYFMKRTWDKNNCLDCVRMCLLLLKVGSGTDSRSCNKVVFRCPKKQLYLWERKHHSFFAKIPWEFDASTAGRAAFGHSILGTFGLRIVEQHTWRATHLESVLHLYNPRQAKPSARPTSLSWQCTPAIQCNSL